jgi:hypothetical protein
MLSDPRLLTDPLYMKLIDICQNSNDIKGNWDELLMLKNRFFVPAGSPNGDPALLRMVPCRKQATQTYLFVNNGDTILSLN